MKHAITGLLTVLALAWPGAALASDLPAGGMTLEEIATWLQEVGFKAEIQTSDGQRHISSSSNGQNFHIYQYDCKLARCGSMQFSVGFTTRGALTADRINEWNRDNRWARSYVDRVNDPWVEYDIDLTPGGTYEHLNDEFTIWRNSLGRFRTFINR